MLPWAHLNICQLLAGFDLSQDSDSAVLVQEGSDGGEEDDDDDDDIGRRQPVKKGRRGLVLSDDEDE